MKYSIKRITERESKIYAQAVVTASVLETTLEKDEEQNFFEVNRKTMRCLTNIINIVRNNVD